MDRLVAALLKSVPVELRELLTMSGLDLSMMLRLQPLAELFVLARKARGWNLRQAAKVAAVKPKALGAFEDCDPAAVGPWVVPYAVRAGMSALLGEWITANPAAAAGFGWPAPNQLAQIFGALMHATANDVAPSGLAATLGPRDMFVPPPGFAERFGPGRMQVSVEAMSAVSPAADLSVLLEGFLAEDPLPPVASAPKASPPAAPATYQFKVSLGAIRPLIWRRFTVSSELTFAQFHDVLQAVMGWTNSHLHDFEFRGQTIGLPDPEWPRPVLREDRTRLREIGLKPRSKLTYRYDFGDDWEHTLVLEKVLPPEPGNPVTCLAGKRACPPEDCGSVPGYQDLCALLANPKLADDDGLREWAGDFDPEAFDLGRVNAALQRLAGRWRKAAARSGAKKGRQR
jgi:hypothetical protein